MSDRERLAERLERPRRSCARCGDLMRPETSLFLGAPLCRACFEPAARSVAARGRGGYRIVALVATVLGSASGLPALSTPESIADVVPRWGVALFALIATWLSGFAMSSLAYSLILRPLSFRRMLVAAGIEASSGWCAVDVLRRDGFLEQALAHVGAGGVMVFGERGTWFCLAAFAWSTVRWQPRRPWRLFPRLVIETKPSPVLDPIFGGRPLRLSVIRGRPKPKDLEVWSLILQVASAPTAPEGEAERPWVVPESKREG